MDVQERGEGAPGAAAITGLIVGQLAAESALNYLVIEVFRSQNRGAGIGAALVVPLIFAWWAERRFPGCVTRRYMLKIAALVVGTRLVIGALTVATLPEPAADLGLLLAAGFAMSLLTGAATYAGLHMGRAQAR